LERLDALAKIEREEKTFGCGKSVTRWWRSPRAFESAAQQLIEQMREIREAFDALDQKAANNRCAT